MADRAAQNFLVAEIDRAARKKDQLVSSYRRQLFFSKMATVVGSSVVSVLAGIANAKPDPSIHISILVCSGIVTVIAAASAFFTPRTAWRLNQRSREKFRELGREVAFAIELTESGQLEDAKLGAFFAKLQELHQSHLKGWEEMRARDKDD